MSLTVGGTGWGRGPPRGPRGPAGSPAVWEPPQPRPGGAGEGRLRAGRAAPRGKNCVEFGAKGSQRPWGTPVPCLPLWPEGRGAQDVQKETKEEKRNCVSESQLFLFFLRNKPH